MTRSVSNMDIYTNDKKLGLVLKKDFKTSLGKYEELTVATGYVGESYLREIKPMLKKIARKGMCRLFIGMIFHEGVSKKQKTLLTELHEELQAINSQSGVYLSQVQYHGKVYLFNGAVDQIAYLGSSNLSDYGFSRRLECNIKITELNQLSEINQYINHLFNLPTTNMLHEVALKVKKQKRPRIQRPSTMLSDYEISKNQFNKLSSVISEQKIELRVDDQPASGLNLCFGKGRKNKDGLFAPRSWYEVEISTNKRDQKNLNYPVSKPKSKSSKSHTGSFTAYIVEKNRYFKIQMVVHSANGKNISSAESSGGRETLGRYLKGKLLSKGVVNINERITSDTLDAYGRSFITLKKIDNSNYILEF